MVSLYTPTQGTYTYPELDIMCDAYWTTPISHMTVVVNPYVNTDGTTSTTYSDMSISHNRHMTVIQIHRPPVVDIVNDSDNSDYWDHQEELIQTKMGWREKPVQKIIKPVLRKQTMNRRLMFSMSGWVAKNGRIKRSGH
jgi:hypothetical protein